MPSERRDVEDHYGTDSRTRETRPCRPDCAETHLALGDPIFWLDCGYVCWKSKLTVDTGRIMRETDFRRIHFERDANIVRL